MLNTATTYLALLQEEDRTIKSLALDKIEKLVDEYWAEISEHIGILDKMYNDQEEEKKELISVILSKIYYNLDDYESAIEWALKSKEKLNIVEKSQYVKTILKKIIDKYISIRKANFFNKDDIIPIDERINSIVDKIFNRCLEKGELYQAIGLSLESYDLERLKTAIKSSENVKEKLKYTFEISQQLIYNNEYRNAILKVLLELYGSLASSQYIDITLCQFLLSNCEALSSTLLNILSNEEDPLIAYQIAFDLFDNQNYSYLKELVSILKNSADQAPKDKLDKLIMIFEGSIQRTITEQCLSIMNKYDPNVMKNIQKAIEKGGSVPLLGAIVSHSLMNSHTKNDSFLKENLEWVSKATNWARFTTTASLGVIHMGNVSQGRAIMGPYMPGNANFPSIYSQAGAYYGLGLIYAGTNDQEILRTLIEGLSNSRDVFQHGIFLAIGLVTMASHDTNLYERLRDGLYTDDAIVGEAAGIGIGLIMLGSRNPQAIEDLITTSHDTQHEKIIRAIAMALALIMYGAEEGANTLIEQLSREKDPILRYGAMYTIGMAYAGTGNNDAFRKLIKFSVSDANDDVRRAALINIGFLQIRNPELLLENIKVLSLLSESYNPHVRYGAAMALGISCCGTGIPNAFNILQPLFNDNNYYVRQGALLASGLIYSQLNPSAETKVTQVREEIDKAINDKDEHVLVKFGALMAKGFLEIGGRNGLISLVSSSGNNKPGSIIGMALFTQYWYWFPMVHFVNLAIHPCLMIGLDSNLKIVKNFNVLSKSKPSLFAYPKEVKLQEKSTETKTQANVLSTFNRVKAKTGGLKKESSVMMQGEDKKDEEKKDEKKEEKKEEIEPNEEVLQNPCRIIPRQYKFITSMTLNNDFTPIVPKRYTGFILLKKINTSSETIYFEDEIKRGQIAKQQTVETNQKASQDVEMPDDIDIEVVKKS